MDDAVLNFSLHYWVVGFKQITLTVTDPLAKAWTTLADMLGKLMDDSDGDDVAPEVQTMTDIGTSSHAESTDHTYASRKQLDQGFQV